MHPPNSNCINRVFLRISPKPFKTSSSCPSTSIFKSEILPLNDISLRKFGSAGQKRTIVLALKMAELELLNKTILINPILILDDVLAELDITRQNLLLKSVGSNSQCFISATHLDELNKDFLDSAQIIYL